MVKWFAEGLSAGFLLLQTQASTLRVGQYLVTEMRTTGSQSVVLPAAAAASPGPLLEIELSCSSPDLLNQRLWGSAPELCVNKVAADSAAG